MMKSIENTMNPFAISPTSALYNIVTGKEVPNNIRDDLLHCIQIGGMWHQEFFMECCRDDTRFDKPIRRRKVKNFTAAVPKSKVRGKAEKLVEFKKTHATCLAGFCISACRKKLIWKRCLAILFLNFQCLCHMQMVQ